MRVGANVYVCERERGRVELVEKISKSERIGPKPIISKRHNDEFLS